MDEIFTSTHWRNATRRLLINNERILYIERGQGECVVYTITFDNGHTLDLDEATGQAFADQLEELRRPRPPVQFVRSDSRPPHSINPPRRRAG